MISLKGDLPFKIIRVLGEGALGLVFLVEYKNKTGVLKVQKETYLGPGHSLGQYANELYVSLSLSGKKYFPKVEKVFYADNDRNLSNYYIFSEYIEGEPLSNFIKSFKSEEEYKKLKIKILEILDWFCKNNVIHGDFHLNNIMVVPKGKDYDLKVIDFGLSKVDEKCNPHIELIKFIFGLYIQKAPQELLDVFIDYYRQKYLNKEECIKDDKPIFVGFKKYSTKKLNELFQKNGLNFEFFEKCYLYYFEDLHKYINLNWFYLDGMIEPDDKKSNKKGKKEILDFTKYDKYFEKI
jgi:serine/threonine protein kinase